VEGHSRESVHSYRAIHAIAVARIRSSPRIRAYIARRTARGQDCARIPPLFEPTALWDPVSEYEYLRERMGRLYEQIAQQGPEQSPWQPDIEVDETEEFYLVKAELPGITRDNVELQVDEYSLTITGSLREDEGEHVMRRRTGGSSTAPCCPGTSTPRRSRRP
jgi:HSP20 family protein